MSPWDLDTAQSPIGLSKNLAHSGKEGSPPTFVPVPTLYFHVRNLHVSFYIKNIIITGRTPEHQFTRSLAN